MKSETLLGYLGVKLTKDREVLATEALGFILKPSRKTEASQKLVQLVNHALGVALPENLYFRTQVTGDEGVRPDLSGRDDNGDERLLIEAKFGAGLTKNQPNAYLGRFRTSNFCVLLFIVPERRREEVWCQMLSRCSKKYQPAEAQPPLGWQAARLKANQILALTTWDVVLQALQGVESQVEAENVRQLKGLCDPMDDDPFVPFRAEDFSSEKPRLVRQLMKLVDAVVKRLGKAAEQGMKQDRYELRFKLGGVQAGMRIDYKRWASEHPNTPLWLVLYGNDEHLSKCRRCLKKWEEPEPDPHRIRIPITLPLGAEKESVVKAVCQMIREVEGKLQTVKDT